MSGQGVSASNIDRKSVTGLDRADSANPDGAGEAAGYTSFVAHGVGQQLRVEREAKALTVDDVSRALKLSTRQVEALEADDWPNLPCKTIIRGFVRNYARHLGLNPEALMTTLDGLDLPKAPELEMSVGTPVSMPVEGQTDRRDTVRVLAGLVVLILAVLAYFLLPPDVWQSTVQAFRAATQSSQPAEEVEAASPSASQSLSPGDQVQAAEPAVQPSGVALPVNEPLVESPAVSPAVLPELVPEPVANLSLQFSFAQPSWVEVRDGNGQIIFSQKNPAGSQREVVGQPPFSLVVGNAAHVTLHYKGKPIDLSRRSKDDVARVTVE